ncbi:MAG: hypothetical protein Q8865_08885 [Bacillota bacterium]|nr:hypothetical protein [Bacillota bacterium]
MAQYTPNYNLKKPDRSDLYSVTDMNSNADIIDNALALVAENGIKSATYDDLDNMKTADCKGVYLLSDCSDFVIVTATSGGIIFQYDISYDGSDIVTESWRTYDASDGYWEPWISNAKIPSGSIYAAGIVQLNDTLTSTSSALALTANQGRVLQNTKAPLVSPAFTGTPTAPTPTAGDSSTKLATTAFVNAAVTSCSQTAEAELTSVQNQLNVINPPQGIARANLGNPSALEAGMIDSEATNKLWFYDVSKISFETSTDDVTYTSYAVSDSDKANLVSGNSNADIRINKGSYMRITIDNDSTYVFLDWMYLYLTTNGDTMQIKIDKKRDDSTDWVTVVPYTNAVSTWPGHIFLPHDNIAFSNQTTQYHYNHVRITVKANSGTNTSTNFMGLYGLEWWGGTFGKRTIYSWDANKNVTFPASVTAATPPTGDNSSKLATTAFVKAVADGISGIKVFSESDIDSITEPGIYVTSTSDDPDYLNVSYLFVAKDVTNGANRVFQEQFKYKSKDDPYFYSLLYRTSFNGGASWDTWRVHALPSATTTSLGVVQLNDTLTSTSNALALTANQGRVLQSTKAPLYSPALTGTPTAPTPTAEDNSTKLATTAFVKNAVISSGNLPVVSGNSGKMLICNGTNWNAGYGITKITNVSSENNSAVYFNDTGIIISRNIVDSNTAFTVNQANAASTGKIASFQFGGTEKASISKNGFISAAGYEINGVPVTGLQFKELSDESSYDTITECGIYQVNLASDVYETYCLEVTSDRIYDTDYSGDYEPGVIQHRYKTDGSYDKTRQSILSSGVWSDWADTADKNEISSLDTRLEAVESDTYLQIRNMVNNGNFSNGTVGWTTTVGATLSSSGVGMGTMLATLRKGSVYIPQFVSFANHVYYVATNLKTTSSNVGIVSSGNMLKYHSGSGNFEIVSINTTALDSNLWSIGIRDYRSSGWDNIYIGYFLIVDLTCTFGAGNEPTAAEMDVILAQYTDNYGYFNEVVNLCDNQKFVPYLMKRLRNTSYNASQITEPTSNNNATIALNTAGTVVTRNVADGNAALTINQVNSASTGEIASFQFNGTKKASIDKNGNFNTTGNITTSGNVKAQQYYDNNNRMVLPLYTSFAEYSLSSDSTTYSVSIDFVIPLMVIVEIESDEGTWGYYPVMIGSETTWSGGSISATYNNGSVDVTIDNANAMTSTLDITVIGCY